MALLRRTIRASLALASLVATGGAAPGPCPGDRLPEIGDGGECFLVPVDRAGSLWMAGTTGVVAHHAPDGPLGDSHGTVAARPGETWHGQGGFRDHDLGPTSNLTDGVSVTIP